MYTSTSTSTSSTSRYEDEDEDVYSYSYSYSLPPSTITIGTRTGTCQCSYTYEYSQRLLSARRDQVTPRSLHSQGSSSWIVPVMAFAAVAFLIDHLLIGYRLTCPRHPGWPSNCNAAWSLHLSARSGAIIHRPRPDWPCRWESERQRRQPLPRHLYNMTHTYL